MAKSEVIERLEHYQCQLLSWRKTYDADTRSWINRNTKWVKQQVLEAGCFKTVTISPPPAVGGMIMQRVDMFEVMFDPPYGMNIVGPVVDMIDQTIGVLQSAPEPARNTATTVQISTKQGYAFVAMPMNLADPQLADVLDAIKEAASRCGVQAERIDEPESNERITDRMLDSIRAAEWVIADLTNTRPNVFYEAGFAQGLGKTPIFIAREGTALEFDLKDYPVIFFSNMKTLKERLEKRLRALAATKLKP